MLRKRTLGLGEQSREWLPIRRWLPSYERRWLRGDLTAGSVVAALAIPQALGYATIAGLPVQVGLYSLPLALLLYAIFGSSTLLIVGPVSTVAVLSGSLIKGFNPASTAEAVAAGSGMAITAGVILMLASVLKVGWLAEFLSKPIVTGFVLGLTVLVIIGELPNILGIPVAPGSVGDRIQDLLTGLGDTQPLTFTVGASALALLFLGDAVAPKVPWALVVLLVGLVVSNVADLSAHGVAVVGEVPQGLPTPSVPTGPALQFGQLMIAGAAIAFVGLAEGLSAARLFAGRRGDRIDANQELFAVGTSNVSSGLIGGFGVAGSLSKTATAERSGGRTQVAGLTTAGLALATILVLAPLLSNLPKAVLSAIVIRAVWSLMDVGAMRRYARIRVNDLVAAVAAAVGVLLLGPLNGLLLAIGMSVFGLVYRSSRVDVEVMGRVPGEKAAWGGMRNHPERRPAEGVLVLRVDVPVFWVNAASVKDAILARVDGYRKWYDHDIVAVVLDIEGTHQLDTTAVDTLFELLAGLHERNVDLYLVRVLYPVRLVLRRSGFVAACGEDHMWHSISQGVRQARIHHALKEGVLDAGGGYDFPFEVHEERIAPTYHLGWQTVFSAQGVRPDGDSQRDDASRPHAARGASSDVLDLLIAEHRDLQRLLTEIQETFDDETQRDLADLFIAGLVRHSTCEELYLCPAIRAHLPDGDAAVEEDLAEHEHLERLLKDLESVEASEARFLELVRRIESTMAEHIADEEAEQFPQLRALVPSKELQMMRQQVERAQRIAPLHKDPDVPDSDPLHRLVGSGAGLVQRLRETLADRLGH